MCTPKGKTKKDQTEVHTMNDKVLRQVEEMKKQTIGVEVEMNNIARDKAARIAAEFFGTGRYENTTARNGYSTWSAWDADGREWKFQKDVSIAGPDSEKCELVTPILTYADMELLQELIRQLRHAGAKSDEGLRNPLPRRCKRTHTADAQEPCKYYGGPRKPFSGCPGSRQGQDEPLLQDGRSKIFRTAQQEKAKDNGAACGHLVHLQRGKLRQDAPLQ